MTENPVPRSFFAPKPNGNACYAGYGISDIVIFDLKYTNLEHSASMTRQFVMHDQAV